MGTEPSKVATKSLNMDGSIAKEATVTSNCTTTVQPNTVCENVIEYNEVDNPNGMENNNAQETTVTSEHTTTIQSVMACENTVDQKDLNLPTGPDHAAVPGIEVDAKSEEVICNMTASLVADKGAKVGQDKEEAPHLLDQT